MSTAYATGAIVNARGREWVVLPDSEEDFLKLRPLGGTDAETTGICLDLEKVESARFSIPDAMKLGDYFSCKLLRDSVKIGFRSSAGPFRSFGRLAFEPRPYQLVPLLMALKLDPLRLLIADDVGIGKTIEALLIARELLDRGEISRIAVVCPPHLAEQWQMEMRTKFNINAELVLPTTIRKLESQCAALNQSIFEINPFVIVSIDFIKSSRRVDDFIRSCPEFVIVDEAHSCAAGADRSSARHQRFRLITQLTEKTDRHVVLVTATPHSGNEQAFRSLLGLMSPEFAELSDEIITEKNKVLRQKLAMHMVQRRRADIKSYMKCDTVFPERFDAEDTYKLSPEYSTLFKRAVEYAKETVRDKSGTKFIQRIRWWSALALLRSLASSPAAAAATLRRRAAVVDAENENDADIIGMNSILDITDEENIEGIDVTPGSDDGSETDVSKKNRRRLLDMAKEADALCGDGDLKLVKLVKILKDLIREGHNPIVFCRFIDTAEYVAKELRERLGGRIEISAITGLLAPEDRESRIEELAAFEQKVLVCTDCLSEGINLQEYFDSVVHYDLSWNPTRHEQREGRVDRFGQPKTKVRVMTLYGIDNQIDGIVLDVLLRKHKKIKNALGISVAVPVDSEKVVEAIFEGLLLKEKKGDDIHQLLPGFDDYFKPQQDALHKDWENAAEKEKKSRTIFAQYSIKVEELARELDAIREAIGSSKDIENFAKLALRSNHAVISDKAPFDLNLTETPVAIREAFDMEPLLKVKFDLPVSKGETYLHRTHPYVERLANYVLDTSLDDIAADNAIQRGQSVARRAGVIRTSKVQVTTTLLLLRLRYHIITVRNGKEISLLAEDSISVAFEDAPQKAKWLGQDKVRKLYELEPEDNVPLDIASQKMQSVVQYLGILQDQIAEKAKAHGKDLLDAHTRVRIASKTVNVKCRIEPCLPPDILGIYHFMPNPKMNN